MSSTQNLAARVVAWQAKHGRHHLPWQQERTPYRVWLSEIMLQQTQVTTVIDYYQRFLERFPTVADLANATQDDVMPYWAGLGYYARARNLHRCAQQVMSDHRGSFPPCSQQLATLPGIGRSTAAAIASFCFGERSPIMDGNVKRVFTRYFGIHGHPQQRQIELKLWSLAEEAVACSPADLDMAAYTQGLMDLGSMLCTRSKPNCAQCPLVSDCYAHANQQTAELPTRKPRAVQPERECHVLILEADGHVLLEQRPDSGIWGGLWTLPQFEQLEGLQDFSQSLAISLPAQSRMAAMLHVFSHFKLHINPWFVQCADLPTQHDNQHWIAIEDLPNTALPAPIRKLLDGLYPNPETELATLF